MRHRLTLRIAGAVGAVAVVLVVSIALLAVAIIDLRDSADAARQSERTLRAAAEVGSLVIDVETGQRGFALAQQDGFLEPLEAAGRRLPAANQALLARPSGTAEDARLASRIATESEAYLTEYAQPLVDQIRTDGDAGRAVIRSGAGKRRVDVIRADIAALSSSVRATADRRTAAASANARRALGIAIGAGVLAVVMFVGLILYLSSSVASPIRRAAEGASQLGRGDLGVRLTERRSDEIGRLSEAFNAMGEALQESAAEVESQHAELETQNGELERQAVELESQTVELEAQAAELEAGQEELTAANVALLDRTASLEETAASLREANERIAAYAGIAEELASRPGLSDRADTLLRSVGDLTDSVVGVLFAVTRHDRDEQRAVSLRGIAAGDVEEMLGAGDGLAGRAIAEGRTVLVSHGEGDLVLRTLGAEVSVRHELHVPLIHSGEVVGVLSLGRTSDRPFGPEELQVVEHLTEQGAIAIANAIESQRSRWLADLNRAVLDAAGVGIHMVDMDGQRILTNPEMDRLLEEVLCPGADLGTLGPAGISEYIAGRTADPAGYRARMAEIIADPDLESVEEYELLDLGRTVRRYTAPVKTPTGESIGRIFVLSETTEQHEAQRAKDELMATVSHELRTPLSAILGFTELLMARDYDAAERKEYLGTVHQQASRLSDLISDFLDLQRLEHSDEGLTLRPIDLREILAGQVKLFSAQSQRHVLELRAAQQDLAIQGDADRLRRALANLLSNAIKYSPEGGDVTIDARRENGNVTISVTDRGLGIPAAAQDRIFDRFYRVDSSETSRIGGTGLGLSLVREIVRAHHGEVGFDSVEGQGSRFWMRVPAA